MILDSDTVSVTCQPEFLIVTRSRRRGAPWKIDSPFNRFSTVSFAPGREVEGEP